MHNIKEEIPNPSLTFVLRDKWKALPPKYREALPLPAQRLIFAYTETNKCLKKDECIRTVQEIQKDYMNRGMPDLPFSFMIGGDLRIYEGRGWGIKIRRPDIRDWHDNRIVFAYICKSADQDKRVEKMIDKAYELMYHGIDNLYLVNFDRYLPQSDIIDIDAENINEKRESASDNTPKENPKT